MQRQPRHHALLGPALATLAALTTLAATMSIIAIHIIAISMLTARRGKACPAQSLLVRIWLGLWRVAYGLGGGGW